MRLVAKSLKISAAGDTTCWGGSFSENGLFILLETARDNKNTAQQKGQETLDLILTKVTNYKKRDLSTLTDLLGWAKSAKVAANLTVGFLEEDILYLGDLGGGEVLLERDKNIGTILSPDETASGRLKVDDRLLFTSKTFRDCVEREKQEEVLKSDNLTSIVEQMYALLVSHPGSSGAAALLVELENQIDDITSQTAYSDYFVSGLRKKITQKWHDLTSLFKHKTVDLWQEQEESKSRKTLATIAVVLILLLLASIFFNITQSQSKDKENRLRQTLDLVSHQYNEAVSLLDLNPTRSRILLADSKLSLSQLLKDFPKNSNEYRQLNEWLTKIAEKEVAAYKIYRFTSTPLFFDINLIKPGGVGSKMALYKKIAVILDTQNRVAFSLSLDTKQSSIIAGSEVVKDAESIAIHGKTAYLVNNDGIVQMDLTTKSSQVVIKADKEWGEISQIVAFAGNLYLLDRKNNAIWKYIAADNGFSARTSYLNPGVRVSLGGAQKMVIDGSVWVLADSATLVKFASGHIENFAFKGLADTIADINSIFTADEEKRLYVLDKHSSRILVFDKEGDYQEQYQWDELKNASDLVVSEEEKKIFVLAGSKIYAIDIK